MKPVDGPVLDRIEQVLTELTHYINDADGRAASLGGVPPRGATGTSVSAMQAEHRLKIAMAWDMARKERDKAFGADLFTDPAWSMLLDLYIGRLARHTATVSSLSAGANVPLTTGARWVKILEKAGLVRREGDAFDRRRILVFLTDQAIARIDGSLDQAIERNRQLGFEYLARLE